MRFRIEMKPEMRNSLIPYNYSYYLMVNLYDIFFNADPEYSEWLHDEGYQDGRGKRSKLFTFSQIYGDEIKPTKYGLKISSDVYFYFAAPKIDKHINTFVQGVFQSRLISLYNRDFKADFTINSIIKERDIELKDINRFKMLSPTVASIKSGNRIIYLQPEDTELIKQLENNLRWKYKLINNEEYHGNLQITFDEEYLKRHKKISKLITIKEGTPNETKVRGFICPIYIDGDESIKQVAMDAGIGQNIVGCGMVGVF